MDEVLILVLKVVPVYEVMLALDWTFPVVAVVYVPFFLVSRHGKLVEKLFRLRWVAPRTDEKMSFLHGEIRKVPLHFHIVRDADVNLICFLEPVSFAKYNNDSFIRMTPGGGFILVQGLFNMNRDVLTQVIYATAAAKFLNLIMKILATNIEPEVWQAFKIFKVDDIKIFEVGFRFAAAYVVAFVKNHDGGLLPYDPSHEALE